MRGKQTMRAATINAALAAHIRHRVKTAGVKARVRISPGGGSLQVVAPAYDAPFTNDEQREIRLIAKCNGLSWVRGVEIDIEQMTNPSEFHFYAAVS